MLLNSSANQTVEVYTGSDRRLVFSLRGQGKDNDNRGTVVLTSGTDGKVSVEISVDGKECASVLQHLSAPNSGNSQVVIVAACNGADADSLYNDAYVVLTCCQPT
ncbi:fucose-binding lectin [Paraburkholderia sp. NMBU_R16]|uniref:fucose-binding lectin II n=1 Tax=Paraburkholderia sp. NMBU_R16 TaxID=2698676 RepID=UPI001563E14D|nr:fucose-binding lectin [Paraburkholderia sp. NMBU_R16]